MIQWMEENKSRLSQGRKALLFFPIVSIGVVKGGRWALTLKWGSTVVKRRNYLWWAHEPTPGRRGQHMVGTGSSPTLSLARARAQKGEQTPAHGLFNNRHFFAAKAPQVWQNVIPLIENSEWELCGTLPLMKIEYQPGTGTGLKRSSKGKGAQGEESQSLACLEAAVATPPQSRHLNSAPHNCKL